VTELLLKPIVLRDLFDSVVYEVGSPLTRRVWWQHLHFRTRVLMFQCWLSHILILILTITLTLTLP